VPCDELPQVMEALIRFGAFDKMRKHLRLLQSSPSSMQATVRVDTVKQIIKVKK